MFSRDFSCPVVAVRPARIGGDGEPLRQILAAGLCVIIGFAGILGTARADADPLTLERAVRVALEEDPGLRALSSAGSSEEDFAEAEASYPDPEVAVAAQNFPVDTFDFGQEPMTQYRVALRQSLPRGASRSLQRERRHVRASQYELRAHDRRATIIKAVRIAWIDAVQDLRIARLLDESAPLFAELARIAESAYSVGDGSQQDVIRAQLEQLNLEDRNIRVREQAHRARVALARWVGGLSGLPLPMERVQLAAPSYSEAEWETLLRTHPTVAVLDLAVDERGIDVALAEQDYKPRFGVEVAYGARGGEDASGHSRPDFLSVGMTFDLPIFTGNRQDRRVSAARHLQSAAASQRLDQVRQLKQSLDDALRRRGELQTRLVLYEGSIVPASDQAARAALAGYRADANDFSEVMRSYIGALDARIELETLSSSLAQNSVELDYLAAQEE